VFGDEFNATSKLPRVLLEGSDIRRIDSKKGGRDYSLLLYLAIS